MSMKKWRIIIWGSCEGPREEMGASQDQRVRQSAVLVAFGSNELLTMTFSPLEYRTFWPVLWLLESAETSIQESGMWGESIIPRIRMEIRTKQDDNGPVQNKNTKGTQEISLNCYPRVMIQCLRRMCHQHRAEIQTPQKRAQSRLSECTGEMPAWSSWPNFWKPAIWNLVKIYSLRCLENCSLGDSTLETLLYKITIRAQPQLNTSMLSHNGPDCP